MKLFKVLLLFVISFLLVACAHSRYNTKKNNYLKQSKTLPPIVVPSGAMAPEQKPYYPVSNRPVHVVAGHAPSLKPPGLQ